MYQLDFLSETCLQQQFQTAVTLENLIRSIQILVSNFLNDHAKPLFGRIS